MDIGLQGWIQASRDGLRLLGMDLNPQGWIWATRDGFRPSGGCSGQGGAVDRGVQSYGGQSGTIP